MRVCPETIYRWVYSSRPLRERWARCLPRGHRRRRRHGGRRTSRFPIPGRVPISERPRGSDGGARSAIGRPTASSEWDATCTPRWRGRPGSSWPASFRTRPPARASGRSWRCSRRCRPARASASRTTTAPSSPTTKGCATGWAWPRTSPTRTPAGSGEQREPATASPPVSAQTLRDTDGHGKEVREIVDEINNRPMRVLGYRTPAEAFADELLELQDQQGCCTSK